MYKEETINFKSLVAFTGRNGRFKQKGLSVANEQGVITLSPITSKGDVGRCVQQIPIDQVPQVIEALQRLTV